MKHWSDSIVAKYKAKFILEAEMPIEADSAAEALKALDYQLAKQAYPYKVLSLIREGVDEKAKCPECERLKTELRTPAPPGPPRKPGGKPNGGGNPGAPVPSVLAA